MQPVNQDHAARVRSELNRILQSPAFEKAKRSQRLIAYVVEAALSDPPVPVKEYTLAVDVFDRPAHYDPSVDATVRVEAGRLRSRLRDYYASLERKAEVVIDLPKGGYAVAFSFRTTGADADSLSSAGKPSLFPSDASTPSSSLPASSDLAVAQFVPADRSWRNTGLMGVICVAVLLAAFAGLLHGRAVEQPVIRSLAILPLRNLSGSPDQDYLAEGMTDELNTELARIPNLRVIAHQSVMHEDVGRKSLKEIAKELNVDAVVVGSVLRDGNKIRINTQVTDLRDDRQLWAASIVGDANDLIQIQSNVAEEIASHARLASLPVSPRSPASAPLPLPEAHDAYLRGRYFVDRRDPTRAVESFQHAIDLDPKFASAYAGLAEALESEIVLGPAKAEETHPKSIAAARKAIELDPENGPAYSALGNIELNLLQWSPAEADLLKGIQLSPGDSYPVTLYGLFLESRNEPIAAVAQMRRASQLDPLSFFVSRNLGMSLYFARRYDEAIVQLERAKELQPDKSGLADNWIAMSYEMKGMREEAVQHDYASLRNFRPQTDLTPLLSAYNAGGWKAYWKARLAIESTEQTRECYPHAVGLDLIRLGELDKALDELQLAYHQRCYLLSLMEVDPRVDALRSDPRFAALVHDIRSEHSYP